MSRGILPKFGGALALKEDVERRAERAYSRSGSLGQSVSGSLSSTSMVAAVSGSCSRMFLFIYTGSQV